MARFSESLAPWAAVTALSGMTAWVKCTLACAPYDKSPVESGGSGSNPASMIRTV